jgi:hypothetical protein
MVTIGLVNIHRSDKVSRIDIPQPDRFIVGYRDQLTSIVQKNDFIHDSCVPFTVDDQSGLLRD